MPAHRPAWSSLLGLADAPKRRPNGTGPRETTSPSAPHRTTMRVLKRQRRRTPSIDQICRHLGCDLIKMRAAGDPGCYFLGRNFSKLDECAGERATPQFRTLDSLEYFCDTHIERYLELDCFPRRPRDWFWNDI